MNTKKRLVKIRVINCVEPFGVRGKKENIRGIRGKNVFIFIKSFGWLPASCGTW